MGVQERRRPQGQVSPSCEMLPRVEEVEDRGMTVGLGLSAAMVLAECVSEGCVPWPQAGRQGGELALDAAAGKTD